MVAFVFCSRVVVVVAMVPMVVLSRGRGDGGGRSGVGCTPAGRQESFVRWISGMSWQAGPGAALASGLPDWAENRAQSGNTGLHNLEPPVLNLGSHDWYLFTHSSDCVCLFAYVCVCLGHCVCMISNTYFFIS